METRRGVPQVPRPKTSRRTAHAPGRLALPEGFHRADRLGVRARPCLLANMALRRLSAEHGAQEGVSSWQLSRVLGVTPKTAWFMEQRIGEACEEAKIYLEGVIEIDETYLGGKDAARRARCP
ncbi:MAG: hypothetical protein M2R46_04592 [Verrucomicrobia subdivision 3 bacterium]|nr:hypothetical protein [Limisphaerales bacterium]